MAPTSAPALVPLLCAVALPLGAVGGRQRAAPAAALLQSAAAAGEAWPGHRLGLATAGLAAGRASGLAPPRQAGGWKSPARAHRRGPLRASTEEQQVGSPLSDADSASLAGAFWKAPPGEGFPIRRADEAGDTDEEALRLELPEELPEGMVARREPANDEAFVAHDDFQRNIWEEEFGADALEALVLDYHSASLPPEEKVVHERQSARPEPMPVFNDEWDGPRFDSEPAPEQTLVDDGLDGPDFEPVPEQARGDEPRGPRPEPVEEELAPMLAANRFQGREEAILLPESWVRGLAPGSAKFWAVDDGPAVEMFGFARLAADSARQVQFEVWRAGDPATARQTLMLDMLSSTGLVPKLHESRRHGGSVYLLLESAGTRSLGHLLQECRDAIAAHPDERSEEDTGLLMPLKRALPLMIDMLWAAEAMEVAGVVHGALTERTIFLHDGDTHTVVPELRRACLVHTDNKALSPETLPPPDHGLAFRCAPEMENCMPNGVANNVWQLGLVFARMLFDAEMPAEGHDDSTPEGRQRIRDVVRQRFSIRQSPKFRWLRDRHGDVMDLVAGMLETDPARRLTASAALEKAMEAARDRGIPEEPPREPQELPARWKEPEEAFGVGSASTRLRP